MTDTAERIATALERIATSLEAHHEACRAEFAHVDEQHMAALMSRLLGEVDIDLS